MRFFDNIKKSLTYDIVYPRIIMQSNKEVLIEGVDRMFFCDENIVKVVCKVRAFKSKKTDKILQLNISGEDMKFCYLKADCVKVEGNIVALNFVDGEY